MAICVISQPRLFPGLHYLHRMMVADVFVIFDTVQFNPRHEENRAKRTAQIEKVILGQLGRTDGKFDDGRGEEDFRKMFHMLTFVFFFVLDQHVR